MWEVGNWTLRGGLKGGRIRQSVGLLVVSKLYIWSLALEGRGVAVCVAVVTGCSVLL